MYTFKVNTLIYYMEHVYQNLSSKQNSFKSENENEKYQNFQVMSWL